ncbi:MAG TPA: hypothetical protein VEU30_15225 [Thermoanaerobaculia bacterium]|nr:hypothetical protein [Thermoanaerobaculia bacterium]
MKRHALKRNASRTAQIARTFALALLLAAIAIPVGIYGPQRLLFYAIAAGFGIVSLLLFYSAVHQLFALRTAETVVEIDADELNRGAAFELFVRQPGSGELESLRANLVGEERWWQRNYSRKRRRMVAHLATVNLFDSGPFSAPYESSVTVTVPRDLPRATAKDRAEHWRIEVWGNVKGRADFQHVFPVKMKP